jgi:hypothetical protein
VLSKRATAIAPVGACHAIELDGTRAITARTVIITTGVTWRRLAVPALETLHGIGVFYGAAASDAISGEEVRIFIVGAGNSAGQAAVHAARSGAEVTLLVRGERLGASMSDYLVRELEHTPNIHIRVRTEVVDGAGPGRLTRLTLRDNARGVTEEVPADALYVMIGAHPQTDWPGRSSGRPCSSRPACPACSRPATCGTDRSSASPPPWGTEAPRCSWRISGSPSWRDVAWRLQPPRPSRLVEKRDRELRLSTSPLGTAGSKR